MRHFTTWPRLFDFRQHSDWCWGVAAEQVGARGWIFQWYHSALLLFLEFEIFKINCEVPLCKNKHHGGKGTPARQLLEHVLRKGRAFHPTVSVLREQQEKKEEFPLCTPSVLLPLFTAGLRCVQFVEELSGACASLRVCLHPYSDSVR